MAQVDLIHSNFTKGEVTDKLRVRSDIQTYYNSLARLENFLLMTYGGITRSPGTRYVGTVKDQTKKVRLMPFKFDVKQSYILEFGHLYIRFYRDGGQIQSGGNAVEVVTPYTEADLPGLQFAQSADVLYILHQNYEPRKLIRFSHTSWTLQIVLFSNPPTYEADTDISGILPVATLSPAASTGTAIVFTASAAVFAAGDVGTYLWYPYLDGNNIRQEALAKIVGFTSTTIVTADIIQSFPGSVVSPNPAILNQKWRHRKTTLTPGNTSGDSITFTASQSVFLAGDVERDIKFGQSRARIKTVSSATAVIANIITAFPNTNPIPAGDWVLQGSPGVALDPTPILVGTDVREPVGRFNTMVTASDVTGTWVAIASYRDPDDVGKYIKVWGGVLKVITFNSSSSTKCQVKSELDAPTANPVSSGVGGWTLEVPVWNKADGYPKAITYFEGRQFMGNTLSFPFRLWGSKSNDFENFCIGYLDDDGVQWDLLSGQVNAIEWLSFTNTLFAGCFGSEIRIDGAGKPLTPSNFQVKPDTEHGSLAIQPLRPQNGLIFVQRDGKRLREVSYNFDADVFEAKDLTLLSDHIVGSGIKEIAYQQEPNSLIWVVTKDGHIACMAYEKAEEIFGWSRRTTGKLSSNDTGFLASPIFTAYFENIAVIPHPSSDKDQVWVVVKRKINSEWKRYIEYFDDDGVYYNQLNTDCSLTWGYSLFYADGTTTAFVASFDIQASADVEVYVDGVLKTITTDYTVDTGTDTITFVSAPADRSKIQFFNKRKVTTISLPRTIGTGWAVIGGGYWHSLAIKTDNTLWAWGDNFYGQLGDGTLTDRWSPVQIGTDFNWNVIGAGGSHTLGLKTNNTLWAWGQNNGGQLGDNTIIDKVSPVQIGTGTNWSKIAAGGSHSLGIKTDGTLWAWGANNNWQLGDGTTTQRNSPVQIGTDTNWSQVAAGASHSLALKINGTLWAWGANNSGQGGNGAYNNLASPTQIGFATDWTAIDGGFSHSIALKSNGTFWAWGDNLQGELGNGGVGANSNVPIQIGTDTNWSKIAAPVGGNHTLGLKTDGTLWAWGRNQEGQLGDNTTVSKNSPIQTGTDTNWNVIGAGGNHTLGLKTNNTLWGWGFNFDGQLGDGTTTNRWSPVQIGTGGLFSHLENETVDIVGDGSVQAQKVVTSSAITLDYPASKVEIGLPYTSTLETLEPEIPNNTLFGRTRRWKELWFHLKDSISMTIGNAPTRDDKSTTTRSRGEGFGFVSIAKYVPEKKEIIFTEGWHDMDKPPPLFSGKKKWNLTGWESEGRFVIEQNKPYPLTILGYTGRLDIGN